MKISQEMGFWFKISVKAVWCTEAVEWISRQGLETWKHRQSAEENPQDIIVWKTCSSRPRSRTLCSVRRTSQKGTDQLAKYHLKLPFSVQVCTVSWTIS